VAVRSIVLTGLFGIVVVVKEVTGTVEMAYIVARMMEAIHIFAYRLKIARLLK